MSFETFDLSAIYVAGDQILLSASSRLGSVNALPRAAGAWPLEGLADRTRRFNATVGRGAPGDDLASEIGRHLTDLVFGVPEVLALFQRTRGAAVDQGRSLLLRVLAAPQAAAAAPWELLLDPATDDRQLAFATDVNLVRLAQSRTYPVRQLPIAPPLNVLLVLSNPTLQAPDDEMPFDLYEERRALLGELEPLVARGLLEVDVVDRPTIEALRRAIGARGRGYHVVHYLGHARPTGLKLEDREGIARWVDGSRFNDVLRACPDLRLTFFAGCRTSADVEQATTGDGAPLLSIADQCVREACQTVVGMQAVLPFRAERVLTRFFYQALASGFSIAEALRLARAAVRDDDEVGSPQLDWAVPALYTGDIPAAIVDPAAPAQPPPSRPIRAELKLELAESDREFFARQSQLRTALDVLSRRSPSRVLCITGPSGAGKSRLAARALDDVDDVDAVLYTPWRRLDREDAVLEVCNLVVELVGRCGGTAPAREPEWTSEEWWDRLIEVLTGTKLVFVVDDLPLDVSGPAAALGRVLSRLVQRRTQARVALVSTESPGPFLNLDERLVSLLRVEPLSFTDVWDWIRRNRPALAAFGREALTLQYATLGPDLEAWSDLGRLLAREPGAALDLDAAVRRIRPAPSPTTALPVEAPVAPEPSLPPKPGDPLLVAIAGVDFLLGDSTSRVEDRFAKIVTALADHHGVSGRIVTGDVTDSSSSIARLAPITSPFTPEGTTTDDEMVRWLEAVRDAHANIVLLDYGAHGQQARRMSNEALVKQLIAGGALVIAAAGNVRGRRFYPGWLDGVLAVGSVIMTPSGSYELSPHSWFDSKSAKPELFAVPNGGDPALATVIDQSWQGSSPSAFLVTAAAILVWASDRTLAADEVRQILLDTAVPLKGTDGARRLDMAAAVAAARTGLVERHLKAGGGDLNAVAATSGIGLPMLKPLLDDLVDQGKVAKRVTASADRYELA